ncbi:hypothetical protein [Actinomycetospora sp. NBC_00405]|uniref:hypothetical protein n=1 Tax=Actinomycetospora sp. NBC_00405 TaxID=2975952 RepID=UPI002E233C30
MTDDGLWQEFTEPGVTGRGIALMGKLSDHSSVETTERGTAVRLCWATAPPTAP